ncbi:glycerol-3-phosphate responsive antiterminator [Salicibibacter kimchii]|uniref:Glycerol uptake operon antiterminator regulatory protein n=1 Tax=Salicibibacter kimchii TaxID=2099786 RepID=A0A345BY92_9BACI|nr:glycerol-3-phosphate responsive antiterminator [Salicibibacter kimchii]AXF55923.1 glycerol-3-phosphate responsive antiterminator [Salicibibacter kimchii]
MKTNLHLNDIVQSQVISAIDSKDKIPIAINSECNVAFLLTGDILVLPSYIKQLHDAGMDVFVHMDFIEGLASDKSAIDYIVKEINPIGIITTKSFVIKLAKKQGLQTIQRLFLIDGNAVNKGIEITQVSKPDAIELLPGIIPKVIDRFTKKSELPIIAGGLVEHPEEIHMALEAGALAVSTGAQTLWNQGF